MNLYEISEEYKDILSQIEGQEDSLIIEALLEQLELIEGTRQNKVESVAKYIRTLEGESNSIKSEIARLQYMDSKKQKTIEGMKNYIAS